jgi:hypothetical protein
MFANGGFGHAQLACRPGKALFFHHPGENRHAIKITNKHHIILAVPPALHRLLRIWKQINVTSPHCLQLGKRQNEDNRYGNFEGLLSK